MELNANQVCAALMCRTLRMNSTCKSSWLAAHPKKSFKSTSQPTVHLLQRTTSRAPHPKSQRSRRLRLTRKFALNARQLRSVCWPSSKGKYRSKLPPTLAMARLRRLQEERKPQGAPHRWSLQAYCDSIQTTLCSLGTTSSMEPWPIVPHSKRNCQGRKLANLTRFGSANLKTCEGKLLLRNLTLWKN